MTKSTKRKAENDEEGLQVNGDVQGLYVAKRTPVANKKILAEIQQAPSSMKVKKMPVEKMSLAKIHDNLDVELGRLSIVDKVDLSLASPLVSALLDRDVVPNKKGAARPSSDLAEFVAQHEEWNRCSFSVINEDSRALSGGESSDDEISSIEGMY